MLLQRLIDHDFFSSINDRQRLQNQLNKVFYGKGGLQPAEFPPINVWTSDTDALVRVEIPGLSPEDVEVSLVNDTLTLKGLRKAECTAEGDSCHRQERLYGSFVRSIQMPFAIEADKVGAKFMDGVLEISLPRAEAQRAKKIAVHCE
jgi:HSP20 family protein